MGILQSSNLAALTSALGDVMADFGGLRMTVTTAQANVGDASVSLLRTAGLPPAGIIGIGADVYAYSAIQGLALTGLTYELGGTTHSGIVTQYQVGTTVTDLSRTYSTLDQVKNGYFFATASGDDLTILGRNLGVPRLPVVRSDADYRELIKAMAYAPRGTTYAIESALTALLGAGNFAIHQTPAKPGVVIVTAPYTALTSGSNANTQPYLEGNTAVTLSGTQFTSANVPTGTKQMVALKTAGVNGAPPTGQDFFTIKGTTASVTGNTVTLPGYAATANSNGQQVILRGSTVSRAPGGNNNGKYTIAGVTGPVAAPATVTLTQASGDGTVSGTGLLNASSMVFEWPRDLGKTVTIGSGAAAGTYTVANIYDPYQTQLFDCAQYITPVRVKSNLVTLSPTPPAAPDAPFVVSPSFVNESGLTFVVGGDGIAPDGTFAQSYTVPASGQYSVDAFMADGSVLDASETAANDYALYLDEPYSEIAGYLDELVVAGVQLQFDFS